jgi:hypothetical protein
MSIFGGDNKSNYYYHLLGFYECLSHLYKHLAYREKHGVFSVLTKKDKKPPWPGIKVHAPLSDQIYYVLRDRGFQQMMINSEIDGIKIYESYSYKQVTFYISFRSILGYKKLLILFSKYGIPIEPHLYKDNDGNILLNKMYISESSGIFVRYSTDFYDQIENPPQANDSNWRLAADYGNPQILALSKKYLLDNLYQLRYKDFIYTFLTLKRYEIEVPIPKIILSLEHNKRGKPILKVYLMDKGKVVDYDPYNEKQTKDIVENPEQALENFLKS